MIDLSNRFKFDEEMSWSDFPHLLSLFTKIYFTTAIEKINLN